MQIFDSLGGLTGVSVLASVMALLLAVALYVRKHGLPGKTRPNKLTVIQNQLAIESYRSRSLLRSVKDAVITLQADGTVAEMNPAAEWLTGWTSDKARGLPCTMVARIIDLDRNQLIEDPSVETRNKGKQVLLNGNRYLLKRNNHEYPVSVTVSPVKDQGKKVTGAILVLHAPQSASGAGNEASKRDELTHLITRKEFENRVELAREDVRNNFSECCVVCFDLEHFDHINTEFGEAAGNDILKQTADLLKQRTRKADVLCRLSNNQFGLLLINCKLELAESVTVAILRAIEQSTFQWLDRKIPVSFSAGLAEVNITTVGIDPVAASISACFVAKNKSSGKIHVHQPSNLPPESDTTEAEWIERITNALKNDGFVLYQQTISPLTKDESHSHCEILVRMLDDSGNIIPPLNFLGVAEQFNLMPAIDRWVVSTALKAQKAGEFGFGERMTACSINLSGQSLNEPGFKDFLLEQLSQRGVNAEKIIFEITETTAVENLDYVEELIQEIKKLGCYFSLDDFGTGLSSFGYLKHLSVDFLKIDGSFVKDITQDPIDCAMVDSINHIGHVMGLQTIAEYAADKAIIQVLRTLGVDYAQGFGIAKPQPLEYCQNAHRAA